MRSRRVRHPLRCAPLLFVLAMPSCGSEAPYDWKNREVPWEYGPTTNDATSEHLIGTGTKGGNKLAKGWKCRLHDGSRLSVDPYELSASHPLFGKVLMIVGLFDSSGKQIATFTSTPITAQHAAFSFEVAEAVAKSLYDITIWYREP